MKGINLLDIFKKAFIDFYKNIIVVIPSFILFVFFIIFSWISIEVNYKLSDKTLLILWLVFFSIVSLFFVSFFLSGLIGICSEIVRRKKIKMDDFLKYSAKFCFNNFIMIAIILIVYNIMRYLVHNLALIIGQSLNLSLGIAQGFFFILYFAGLAGIIIFLTFSSFYLITKNKSIWQSIKSSALLVKKRYIYTLSIIIVFFVINGLLELLKNVLIIELINALFIVPYLALVLTRFVLSFDEVK